MSDAHLQTWPAPATASIPRARSLAETGLRHPRVSPCHHQDVDLPAKTASRSTDGARQLERPRCEAGEVGRQRCCQGRQRMAVYLEDGFRMFYPETGGTDAAHSPDEAVPAEDREVREAPVLPDNRDGSAARPPPPGGSVSPRSIDAGLSWECPPDYRCPIHAASCMSGGGGFRLPRIRTPMVSMTAGLQRACCGAARRACQSAVTAWSRFLAQQ